MLGTNLGYLISLLLIAGFGIAIVIWILNELEITRFTTQFAVGASCVLVCLAFTLAFGGYIVDTRTYNLPVFLWLSGAAGFTAFGFYLLLRK